MSIPRLKTDHISVPIIGTVHTPYGEKFAVPRQPGLVPAARSYIVLNPPYNDPQACAGLEGFSHLWLIFLFDQAPYPGFKATVRPPRLGGNTRVGVFASRSPFRPSRLGLSVVRFEGMEQVHGQLRLKVGGADLVDGTPLVDIKPYLPFVDALPEAAGGYAKQAPVPIAVRFAPEAIEDLKRLQLKDDYRELISQVLAQDPRPAYQHTLHKRYGALLCGFNVVFTVDELGALVLRVEESRHGTA